MSEPVAEPVAEPEPAGVIEEEAASEVKGDAAGADHLPSGKDSKKLLTDPQLDDILTRVTRKMNSGDTADGVNDGVNDGASDPHTTNTSGGRRRTKRKHHKKGKSAKKGGKKHRKSSGKKSRRSSSKKSRRQGRK